MPEILETYYDPFSDTWRVPGGYLYRTLEQLEKELADNLRWSIMRTYWLAETKDPSKFFIHTTAC